MICIKYSKKCKYCGKFFKTNKKRKIYCCNACAWGAQKLRYKFKRKFKKRMHRDEMINIVKDEEKKKKLLQQKYNSYANTAKIKYYLFDFTLKEFEKIIKKDCFYCGHTAEPFNGIDRVDSSIGYTKYNSVPCCKKCNRMKMDLSIDDFAKHILKLSKWANSHLQKDILI